VGQTIRYNYYTKTNMAKTALGGNEANTVGNLPAIGSQAPDFTLTKNDLSDVTLAHYSGKKLIMNIFPSIDTGICSASTRRFNMEAAKLGDTRIVCVSKDLPFAFARFCEAEGIQNLDTLTAFRNPSFGIDYGIELADSGFKGLLARAIVVLDFDGKVVYTELVPEIGQEPEYDSALAAL